MRESNKRKHMEELKELGKWIARDKDGNSRKK